MYKYLLLLLAPMCVLLTSCSSDYTPVTNGATDGGGAGTIVEVEHRGQIYTIWHHCGYQSESAVLLNVRSK